MQKVAEKLSKHGIQGLLVIGGFEVRRGCCLTTYQFHHVTQYQQIFVVLCSQGKNRPRSFTRAVFLCSFYCLPILFLIFLLLFLVCLYVCLFVYLFASF